ncbi:hypothetical protein Trydic_g164 [Trypoxylus dichotomus]
MFNTKQEVDRHVENCLKKINSESERNLRWYAFAKLYFKVGDYEQARRYVTIYLKVKPESAEAQQLLGKVLEKLGKYDAALEAYRTSLDLDPKQNKLVLKVCELLASDDVNFDQSGARYYCEKAQSIDPNNPSIYLLKEKLILSEGKDPNDVAKLLLNEIEERPKDFNRRIRLLRHYLQNGQIKEAYDHIKSVEERVQQIAWYETAAEVLVKYQQDTLKKNWEFWMLLIGILEKLVELSMDERFIQLKSNNGYVNHLFNFDQSLKIASENMQDCPDKNLVQEFLNHYRGQLCLHFITLVYKQAKQELIRYKEASQITLPLLFAAYHTQPVDLQCLWITHSSECNKSLVKRWNREASFRCSQTGHMLLSISKDRKNTILEKGAQCSSGLWREQLLKRIFVTRDHQSKIKTSYFATCNQLIELVIRLPEANELIKYDDTAQLVYPNSLHHYIWIGLNRSLPGFKCTVFDGLPFSTKNLNNCTAESLNVLDIHAFIYCATLCAQQQIEEQKYNIYYPNDKPSVIPAAVTSELGTQNQSKFIIAAYKMFTNDYANDFSEVRLTLIKAIETIRCVGNHGLDVKVLVSLAKIFAERSKILEKPTEIEHNDARAELYWKTALPLLEKLKNNQTLSYSPNRLFECKTKEMSLSEIQTYIDDGKLFNGIQFMKKKDYENALSLFESLKDPYASYYQAQICKMKAEEQTSRNKESVTSEMRSQNIILLSRARDCLYLTFDRLRDPSIDRRHPLNSQLGTEIDKIERMLSRIDPDTCLNRNECDGMSDENISLGSVGDHFNYTNYGNSSFLNGNLTPKNENFNLNATPLRLDVSRREARPSPERLDAQLRQLLASKDTAVNHILEQNKSMMDSQRAMLDEIRGFKDAVNNLTATVDEMKGFRATIDDIKELQRSVDELKSSVDDLKNVTDDVLKMKKEIAELKKDTLKIKSNQISDEDLYGLDEEYSGDYTAAINSNMAAAGLPTNLYPTLSRLPQPSSLPYAPPLYHGMYPMLHYPGLGLPQAGSLPYAPENQLPDFRSLNTLQQGLGHSPAFLQQGFSQTGLTQGLTPGGLSQGISHGGLPPTLLPTQGLPQGTLIQTNLGQSPHSNPLIPSTSVFSTLISTNIPNQSVFATATHHLQPSTNILTTTTPSFLSNSVISSKAPPINVVITSSDPLPVTKSAPQPVLSVTIPPQHLKGAQKTQPHNYQIQMPVSSTVTAPSVINQPPIAISTQTLLSNIPPPVYSSIEPQNKSVTLGVAIEKSLNQSFGNNSVKQDGNKSNVSSGSIEEHDAYPDFKPIIPLPDEVPVKTGEENEISLFEERAKLFRYVNKEWKERGIGVLKLLKDVSTGKVRLLMRREQVHKICANHFLTKDMVLTQMPNNEKAYIWAANDFADQEIVLEKLCARFKTTDAAYKFYKAFEDAKKDLADLSESREKSDRSKEDKRIEQIASKPSDPIPVALMGGFVFTSTPTFKPKTTSPTNSDVTPKEVVKPSPFASFTFSKPATTIPSTIAFSPMISDFRTVQSNVEIIDITPQKVESTSNTHLTEISEGDLEEYEPSVDFKPIIALPELVEVKTGEENAEILFEQKAKLLRFDQPLKEWKERGVGLMKILKYDDGTVRLLMRREQVHKVCCNHQLLKSTNFFYMPKNAKILNWYAQDFSEGVLTEEMFAIKFKTEEQVKLFHNVIISVQARLDDGNRIANEERKPIKPSGETKKGDKKSKADTEPKKAEVSPKQAGWGDKYKPKLGSWECKTCFVVNDAKANLCIACDSPKNELAAKKEQSCASQFSFGIKNQTSANSAFNFANSKAENKEVPKSEVPSKENNSSWGNAFKPPADSWECSVCMIRNTKDALYCASCENPKDDTVPKKEVTTKGVNLETPGFNFKFGIPSNLTVTTASTPANTALPSLATTSNVSFGFGTPITKSPAMTFSFGSTLPENKQFTFSIKPDKKPDASPADKDDGKEKFVFGSPQKHTFDFTPRSPRRHSSGHGEEESEGSYVEEEEDNIYFKPVIPLPEKVDVKTGEEQEEVLYCHRAKLFRFADGEWKERGIGDIKILRMPDTGKLRVVMRREQVLKICLNHTLTKDIIYTPKDDKTWLFSAPDFSEGEIQHKQFCIRFKSADIARDFKKSIDSALNETSGKPNIDRTSLVFGKVAEKPFSILTSTPRKSDSKSDDSDVEIVFETKVTPEEEAEAIRLGLPPKFMSYRQLADCTCNECKKDDVLLKEILSPTPYPPKGYVNANSIVSPGDTTQNISIFATPKSYSAILSTPNLNDTKNVAPSTSSFISFTSTPTEDRSGKEETVKDLLIKPPMFSLAQSGPANKPTTSFSSPALVSAVSNLKSEEKIPSTTSSAISGFSFKLNMHGDNQPPASPTTFSANFFGNKTASTSGGSSVYTTSGTSIFVSPLSTSNSTGSIFGGSNQTAPTRLFGNAIPSGGGTVFGGAVNLFGANKTATTTATSTRGSMFGSPVVTPQTSNQSIFPVAATTLASGDGASSSVPATSGEPTTKGSLFAAPPVFGSQANAESKGFGSTPIFGGPQNKPVFGNTTATLTFGSNTALPTAAPLDCSVGGSKLEEKKFDDFLKCDPDLNFANLAKGTNNTPTFVKAAGDGEKTPFAFLGAGAPVFEAKRAEGTAKPKDDKDDSNVEEKQDANASTEEEYDPHYEPIVPLPDAVTVLTGEEDESVLFNERAKLFRYDIDLKEWKERGVGQLKVLYHPLNHTYRLLLRREQVHKVVLNQLITPDLTLQPMFTSEKAWCWGGYNYSEDDHCLEKLAARFTSVELSRQFCKAVQTAIDGVKEYQSTHKMIPSTLEEYVVENVNCDEETRDDAEEIEGEEEEDDLDYYDDDDDDDERIMMFKEKCTLSENVENEWKPVGSGTIIIYYDHEIYGTRINFSDDCSVLSNTLIGQNTEMKVSQNVCSWKAVESVNNRYQWRDLQAAFETEDAAERFYVTYREGVNYAEHSDIVDNIPTYIDTEDENVVAN